MKAFFSSTVRSSLLAVITASTLYSCGVPTQHAATEATLVSTEQWCHIPLKATDGTQIQIDFRAAGPYGRSGVVDILPLWVNVIRPSHLPTRNMRAVIINYATFGSQTIQHDLKLTSSQHFSASFDRIGGLYNSYLRTEIAVVVDGKWLKDPISGKSNFQVDLFKDISDCRS